MSRFVPGGTVDEPVQNDEWVNAQHEIEERRRRKEEDGKQEGGKTLYETLQANKGCYVNNEDTETDIVANILGSLS